MTVVFGTLMDVGGARSQGTVTVSSLVTRAAHGAAATVVTKERHVLPLRNGEFVSPDLDPGPVRVEATTGGAFESWQVTLPEDGRHDLATLIETHVEYAPSVVGRVEAAAAEANRAAQAAGQSATRAGEVEQRIIAVESRIDGIVADGAEAVRAELQTEIAGIDQARTDARAAQAAAEEHATEAGEFAQQSKASVNAAAAAAGRAESAAGDAEESAGAAGESSTLSADAAAVAVAASVATMTYTGDGPPEGKVTAPVGAVYIDRVAATGGVRWIKATGDGPTGWRILWGDTGERDIRGLFPEGHQFTFCTIRRIGDVVYLSINSWRPPEDGASRHNGSLPAGFRSSAVYNFPGVIGGSPGGRFLVSGNNLTAYGLRATSDNFFTVSWTTKDPWPTALPGVPA